MSNWLTSLVFATLVTTVPFAFVLQVLSRLPKPLASSSRRWSLSMMMALIAAITAYAAIFIHNAYYARSASLLALLLQFAIVAVLYVFGLSLILRQFAGVYPDYIVTAGFTGLALQKTLYRNIEDVEEIQEGRDEVLLRIRLRNGGQVMLALPARLVPVFREKWPGPREL